MCVSVGLIYHPHAHNYFLPGMSTHCAHSNLGTFLLHRELFRRRAARHTESAAIFRYVCEKYQPVLLQPEGGRCGTATARALQDQLFAFLLL